MWVMMCESETERALERAAERLLRCRWALSPRTLCVYRLPPAGGRLCENKMNRADKHSLRVRFLEPRVLLDF